MISLVVDGRQNQESSGDSLLGHSQRLCTHVWRQDVPILAVALPFPSKTHVSSQSLVQKHLRRRQRPQWPQVTKTSIGPRTRMDTLHNTVAIRMRWMRGAMTVTIRAVLDVVGDDGNDDESRRDGRRAARHFFRWQTVR